MNTNIENIIVDSCQYTPVYFVEAPSLEQSRSIVITPSTEKPVSDKLKEFYESSGKLEDNLSLSQNEVPVPILKKIENNIGNNLKLANFVLSSNLTKTKTITNTTPPTKNVVLKPLYITNTSTSQSPVQSAPKNSICRTVIKPRSIQCPNKVVNRQTLPKLKPKENIINTKQSKTTSVQLIKLGETYHSLNELSDDQMKIVNHALKIFNNPKNTPKEPTYDPATNTRFIYKVVSPKDLTVIGKNKVILKQKKVETKKETVKKQEKKECKHELEEDPTPVAVEAKVTRSGRKVKLPKSILPEETPQKPKKKNETIATCYQCSSVFSSLYRLQRHYEHQPTHIPARIHSNLFHCLLAIIQTATNEDRANIFLQQIEQFLAKIKSLIPCLLKTDGSKEGKPNTINKDIGGLLGMSPGKYILNIDALDCVKDKDGFCEHNPPPTNTNNESTQPSSDNKVEPPPPVADDCARINSAKKWPTVGKRMEHRAKPNIYINNKKMKLSEQSEARTQLRDEDIAAFFSNNHKTDIITDVITSEDVNVETNEDIYNGPVHNDNKKPSYIQFHSTHFDIRSSPIKPTSKPTVFRKFQINPDKIPKFDIQEIQPLLSPENVIVPQISETDTNPVQNDIFMENTPSSSNKPTDDINYDPTKDWTLKYVQEETNPTDSLLNESTDFLKSNVLIQPALIHMENAQKLPDTSSTDQISMNNSLLLNQASELNFFDTLGNTCLSFPDESARNNSVNDFQLDLLFNNS